MKPLRRWLLLATLVGYPHMIAAKPVVATIYHPQFEGRTTASGERFHHNALTVAAAHFPLGTRLRLRHQQKSVVVRVTDRINRRYRSRIDLSRRVARVLGIKGKATIQVAVIDFQRRQLD